MTRSQKLAARRKRLSATITAAAPTEGKIVAAWDAQFSISAEAPKADAAGKKPPAPRFSMIAYNGGPMRLNGYRNPVIVDGRGIQAAAANIPIYVCHSQPWDDPADQMEQLFGQTDEFAVDQATGQITASGPITGESPMCAAAIANAKNGFKFQASINAQPSQIEFIPEGVQSTVNGRAITGPCVVARAVTCDHIALVPLGADSSTSARIAAEAAKGQIMEFAAWLKATYELDAATLTASQKTKFEAEFARISASGGKKPESETPPVTAKNKADDSIPDTNATITAHRKAMADENLRISKVTLASKDYPEIAARAINEGWDEARTKDAVEVQQLRDARKAEASQAPAGIVATAVPKDGLGLQVMSASRGGRHTTPGSGRIGDDLAAVIETAGLISAGYSAERLSKNPAYGVRAVECAERAMKQFGRGLGPMGLMRLAARFAGSNLPESNDAALETLSASFSTLSLPVILSNLMNKFLLDGYTGVDPDYADTSAGSIAWQKFVKRGPVQDFKTHYRLRLASNLEFLPLGPTGQIQDGKVGEQSYTLQADTKAIKFGLTRQQLINDDLSAMSSLPTHFGRGAGIAVAKLIYSLLILGKQSDRSTAFFSSSAVTTAGNLMQPNLITGSALSFTTLETAQSAIMAQTDPYGQPFGQPAEILLTPPGIMNLAKQLYQSMDLIPALNAGGNSRGVPGKNTLAGLFRPVCSGWLNNLTAAQVSYETGVTTSNAGDNTSWYLLCGPQNAAYPMEAGFLNGQETPIVERNDAKFDELGISFRSFLDFGANLAEPRAIVKATA